MGCSRTSETGTSRDPRAHLPSTGARDLLHDLDGALADERDRHRVGAHAVARDGEGIMRHRLLVTVFLALVTSACATMQGERPPELLVMQEFADQTSKVYGPRPGPTLFTGTAESVANRPPLVRPVLLTHSGGHLLVRRQMVDSPYLVPAVAQALAIRANGGESEQRRR